MAENLSAGVFIEEVASAQNIVQAVSTSNLGAVGFTPRGPTDTATLVTSFEQYGRIFGPDTKASRLPKSIAAFYANGGRRAFIVRVVPSDAVASNAQIQSAVLNQVAETSTGAGSYSQTATSTGLPANNGASTLVPGALTFVYRGVGATAASTDNKVVAADGKTFLVGDGAIANFAGRMSPYATLIVGSIANDLPGPEAITYRATQAGSAGQSIQIAHEARAGIYATITHTITTLGGVTTIIIQPATSASGVIAAGMTADVVAAYVNGNSTLSALVTATQGGTSGPVASQLAPATAVALAGIPTISDPLEVVAGTADVVLQWTHTTGKTLTFPAASAGPVVSVTSAGVASGSFDRRTGMFSLAVVSGNEPGTGTGITYTCKYAAPDSTATLGTTVNPDGGCLLSGAGITTGALNSFVNVVDGSYKITFAAATNFALGSKMLVNYTFNAWDLNPISKGVWGQDLRLDIRGNPDYYSPVYVPAVGQTPAKLAQTYTKFDANVLMKDSLGNYSVMETYEELDFADDTSANYFPDVINELSDLIKVTEPGSVLAPAELAGVAHVQSIGAGDGSNKSFSGVLQKIVGKRSVVITYTSAVDSLLKTITDDGANNLVGTGVVDTSQPHTINYGTGAFAFATVDAPQAGTMVTVSYSTAPAESTHIEYFGNVNKDYTFSVTIPQAYTYSFYTAGTDSLAGLPLTRNEFTDPNLIADSKGLYALNRIDELMQVIIPDFAGNPIVSGDLLDYAETRASQPSGGDRFIILTTPKGCNPQQAVDWFRYDLKRFSKYAALYWPWVNVADSLSNGRNLVFPPMGHIAGIYARTDNNRNVGKAPGGTVDGALQFLTGLEYVSTQGERDYVYPNKINPLISGPQTGLAVWGVRTIAAESEWRYINARRLFMFLEKSVFNSTFWIVFENNGNSLWTKIKAQIGGFLGNLFTEGYFAGNSASQSYYVTCDESNNTQASIDLGQVIVDIGVAPNKPAEFVRFRFQQKSL